MKKVSVFVCALIALAFSSCNQAPVEPIIKEVIKEVQAPDETGLIHTVFFWLKEGNTPEQIATFEKGLASLSKIETVKKFYTGKAAATEERGVVDNSYDYALIIHFADLAGQNAYQPHKIHQDFIAASKDVWEKVVVYDSQVK